MVWPQATIVPLGAPANFTASSKQIGIDVTEFNGARYKQFDDLLDGIFCAYLAYYFWYWETRGVGCWAILKQGV